MEYLILIYNNVDTAEAITGDAREEFERAHVGLQEELKASGELVETRILDDRQARVVRTGTTPLVTDGPFAELREWVGGYYRVNCAGLDRATEIASRFVEARYSPVEVRRIGTD